MTRLIAIVLLVLATSVGVNDVARAQGACTGVNLEAGPIWNNDDAKRKCPEACGGYTWNGQWRTTVNGAMSVCGCVPAKVALEAGPIWNNGDAQGKCGSTCQQAGRSWTGQWWTTVQGEMSVCECGCGS